MHGGIEYKGCVGVPLLILPVTLFLKGCHEGVEDLSRDCDGNGSD